MCQNLGNGKLLPKAGSKNLSAKIFSRSVSTNVVWHSSKNVELTSVRYPEAMRDKREFAKLNPGIF